MPHPVLYTHNVIRKAHGFILK